MFEVKMEEMDLYSKKSKKSLFRRKGYYRKLTFLVLTFVYLACVCGSLVLKAESFRAQKEIRLAKRENERIKRSADLELEPINAGTYTINEHAVKHLKIGSHKLMT